MERANGGLKISESNLRYSRGFALIYLRKFGELKLLRVKDHKEEKKNKEKSRDVTDLIVHPRSGSEKQQQHQQPHFFNVYSYML